MIPSSFEQNLAISRLCSEILASNEHITFVSSINRNGRVIELKVKNDRVIPTLSKQETEMLFMQRTLQTSLCMEFDDLIGPLDCIILQRETLFEFLFPYSEGLFFVMSDLDIIPNYLGKRITLMLRDFEWRTKNPIPQ